MRWFAKRSASVARRVRASFLVAAAVPLLILAAVSYLMVTEQLQERALRESHVLAKDIGMAIYDRLKFVKDELLLIQHHGVLPVGELPSQSGLDLAQRINGLFQITADGEIDGRLFFSDGQKAAILDTVAQADRDKSLIIMSRTSAIRRLFLLAPGANSTGAVHWFGAELNTMHLWNTVDASGRPERICILDPNEQPIFCNHEAPEAWLAASRGLLRERVRPRSLVLDSGEEVLTAAWSLYLRAHYQFERWTVLAGIPRSMALASVQAFDRVFAAVAVLALLLAFVLGTRMIRSNLRPLGELQRATRELSAGSFTHRVRLESGDEFQELGEAFNSMASRIGHQFDELGILATLDRSLQRALSVAEAVTAAASALCAALGPGRCAVLCHEQWEVEDSLWYTRFDDSTASRAKGIDVQRLGSGMHSGDFDSLLRHEPCLHQVGETAAEALQLIPVASSRHVRAEILLADPQADDATLVGRVADVLSTALNKLVLEQRLRYQAGHDWLTGLPNRLRLNQSFDQWAEDAVKHNSVIGLLQLNLDRFKQVNDAHGHAQGDQLLVNVAERLTQALPSNSMLSRFGSDEFVLMLKAPAHYKLIPQIINLAKTLNAELDRPIEIAHRKVRISASMGAAIFPRHGDRFEAMLQNMDAALRVAKASRRGSLLIFSDGMRDALVGRMDLEQALKGAVSNNEIVVHYQPVVDPRTGKTVSAEAMVRWQRPSIGLEMPDRFMAIAEDSGLIVEIGAFVLNEVCRQLYAWRQAGFPMESVSVNVSGKQLPHPDFEDDVYGALRSSGLDPRDLTLEVTETALIGQFDEGVEVLARLRALGVKVMVDDFGTGYASFKYLKMLPVDGLKVDRLFVKDLPDSQRDKAIVGAMISLTRDNGIKLVAEGVETEAQSNYLMAAGVRYLQGFLFDRGLPADAFERRLQEEQRVRLEQGVRRA